MKILKCIVFFLCISMELPICHAQTTASTNSSLIERRVQLHLKDGTFLQALSKLSVDHRVPIGFEPMLGHKDEHDLNIDVDNASLKNVLDMIVEHRDYRWEIWNGVINIRPTKSVDGFVETFLSTSISYFDPPKMVGSSRVRDAITELPEIQLLLKANKITATHYAYFERNPVIYDSSNLDVSISNTDVRGILNKIIRESEHKMWIASRSGENLTLLDIGF